MSQITTTDLAPEALSKLMLEGDLSKFSSIKPSVNTLALIRQRCHFSTSNFKGS